MTQEKDSRLNYDVTITKENVRDMLNTEIYGLMYRYGAGVEKTLAAIAIGVNAYKCLFEELGTQGKFSTWLSFDDCIRFRGIKILCAPIPFFIPIFDHQDWNLAQQEAVRITSLSGGVDS